LILSASEKSSTMTAIRLLSGLTEKKLSFEPLPGTVVMLRTSPSGVRDRIMVLPSRKYTLSLVALTGG
jgi:hypothetical protein